MPRINRNILTILVALLLGVLASFMAIKYINGQVAARTHAPTQAKTRAVVVPTHDLKAGDTLTADDVASREIPQDFVPADVLTPDNYGNHLGQVLRAPLAQGRPIPVTALERISDHFSTLIDPNDVAYTIQVDETNSISGLIVPGDHIDILLLVSKNGKDDIRPLLSDVLVLATGKRARGLQQVSNRNNDNSFSNLTLELSPRNAQRLGIARKIGQLRVMLRSPKNQDNLDLRLFSEADLLGDTPRRRGQGQNVQFIIGGSH